MNGRSSEGGQRRSRAQRMAAGWFLGCIGVAFVLFALSRGAGRLLLPLLAIGGIAYALRRFVQKLREPID